MLTGLDHYTVRAGDLERTVAFYRDTLGLTVGPRPAFDFAGAWLYCGDRPVVHLTARREHAGQPAAAGTGRLDHIAFACRDLPAFRARLARLGVGYDERAVPGRGVTQLFFHDPDGVKIELNFPL